MGGPVMSMASAKGYRGEVMVLDLLRDFHPYAYRPRAGQPHDVGDITGTPIVHSIKNCKALALSTWVDEMHGMVLNAGQETGVVWHHRPRKGHPLDWYVTTSGQLFLPLYEAYLRQHRWLS